MIGLRFQAERAAEWLSLFADEDYAVASFNTGGSTIMACTRWDAPVVAALTARLGRPQRISGVLIWSPDIDVEIQVILP